MSMYTETGAPCEIDPRNALQRVMDRFASKGLRPVTAFELEFYLVDPAVFQRSGRMGKDQGPGPDQQQMYSLSELRGQSESVRRDPLCGDRSGPSDRHHHQGSGAGPVRGQSQTPRRCHGGRGRHCAFAPPDHRMRPQARASGHFHGQTVSGVARQRHACARQHPRRQGRQHFAGEAGDQRLQHAAAGLLATLKDTLLLYIPGFNGYRRLQPGSYAPTRIAWGRNNRSVVVRVPGVR
jgi:glutamine synthetase